MLPIDDRIEEEILQTALIPIVRSHFKTTIEETPYKSRDKMKLRTIYS